MGECNRDQLYTVETFRVEAMIFSALVSAPTFGLNPTLSGASKTQWITLVP